MSPIIVNKPIRPPAAMYSRRSASVAPVATEKTWPMNAPTAMAAANPPAMDVRVWVEISAAGNTLGMLPAKYARVARRTRQVWD